MSQASGYGRLAFDPAERTTKTGKPMGTARLAVDATAANATDHETLWIDLLAFGTQAETLLKLAKGDMASAMGRLTKGAYTAKDGTQREQFTLIADAIVSAKSVRPGARPKREPAFEGERF